MDQEQLSAFDHIAREGSFTRAAISLGIGQPAISARIRALEEQVEIELRDLPPIYRDSALLRRRRSGPLSPAAVSLVQAIRHQAHALGLLTAGSALDRPRAATRRGVDHSTVRSQPPST